MEYQKIINLLNNTPNQPSKFRTTNSVKINDESRGTYNNNSQIKFESSMLTSSLPDYSDVYIYCKGNITISNIGTAATRNKRKKVTFKNCAPFTNCISEINNTLAVYAKDIGVVMPIYDLIEHSQIYL